MYIELKNKSARMLNTDDLTSTIKTTFTCKFVLIFIVIYFLSGKLTLVSYATRDGICAYKVAKCFIQLRIRFIEVCKYLITGCTSEL